ncbi:MAG: phage holin family protein [Clostridia bacterium]
MDLNEYISPELAILVPLLFACGTAIKASKIKDYFIPFLLGIIGIVLANIWVFSTGIPETWNEILTKFLFGTVQGIISAATSVYTHNLFKQASKKGEDDLK